jgi:hypothetical protein
VWSPVCPACWSGTHHHDFMITLQPYMYGSGACQVGSPATSPLALPFAYFPQNRHTSGGLCPWHALLSLPAFATMPSVLAAVAIAQV